MSTNKSKLQVGRMIRKARKELGLSQKDFAGILQVSDKTVSSYEVGRVVPGFNTLEQISKIVHKPISYFSIDYRPEDIDLQIKLAVIERELLEIKKILMKRKKTKVI